MKWTDEPRFTSNEVCELFDITYRQLHYRVTNRYVVPAYEAGGSGDQHRWSVQNIVDLAVFNERVGHCPLKHGGPS